MLNYAYAGEGGLDCLNDHTKTAVEDTPDDEDEHLES